MKLNIFQKFPGNVFAEFIILGCLILPFHLIAQTPGMTKSGAILLPNGWKLSPAGETRILGDLPLNIAVSHSEKLLAVTNNGESDQYVQLFDLKTKILLDSVQMGKSWLGLAFSDNDNFLFVSGGNDNWIVKFAISTGRLIPADTFRLGKPWPERISVAGIAIDDQNQVLYAVTRENNSLYTVDLKSKRISQKLPLGAEGYTCILSPNRKMLYISCWGCEKIKVYDTFRKQMTDSFQVGSHPNDLCLTKNGRYLFVANANDNSVSVIDLQMHKVIEVLNTALYPDAPSGSTTNSVALSKDEHTLYIANADNNCLAVFDISIPGSSKSKGFIPTGWYPTCVRVAKNKILVANGKGNTSLANPFGPDPTRKGDDVVYQKAGKKISQKEQYIGSLFKGTLSIIQPATEKEMAAWSARVYSNTPYSKKKETESEGEGNNPIPAKVGDASPIKYVFYIIKENRSYDQVLGDIPEGNGDTSLVLFGEKITPNQHALAKECASG